MQGLALREGFVPDRGTLRRVSYRGDLRSGVEFQGSLHELWIGDWVAIPDRR